MVDQPKQQYCDTETGVIPITVIKTVEDRVVVKTAEGTQFIVNKDEIIEKPKLDGLFDNKE
jgi:hypothetical protein